MASLASFIENFNLLIDKRKCSSDTIYLRAGISTEDEAIQFIKNFSRTTSTDWIFHHSRHSKKFIFIKTWICHRSWNKKTEFPSPDDKCNAKIVVLLKKKTVKYEKTHGPWLPCIIRICGKHNHNSETDDGLQMLGLTEELKEKFFEYFRSGLNATEANEQEIINRSLNKDVSRNWGSLTNRQVQHLYNHWMNVTASNSKEETDTFEKVTIKEFLQAVPKTEPQQVLKKSNINPFECGLHPPLEFVTVNENTGTLPASSVLLYKLKHGLQDSFLSHLSVPKISCVRIESAVRKDDTELPNVPEVSIKIEPPDIYEEVDYIMASFPDNCENGLLLPSTIKTENGSLPENGSYNSGFNVGNSFFPMIFTLTGTTCSDSGKDTPLLYSLQQGSVDSSTTVKTHVESVQIHSSTQVNLNIRNACSIFTVKVDADIQFELMTISSKGGHQVTHQTHPLSMPVILDVSSCKRRKVEDSSTIDAPKSNTKLTILQESSSTTQRELSIDEDYLFLMSLLPELKQLPADRKQQVKKKVQEFVVTSRICSSRIRFEKTRSNIYRDCGVLPSQRDWKF